MDTKERPLLPRKRLSFGSGDFRQAMGEDAVIP